jgi:Protein of unknown function, DUF547
MKRLLHRFSAATVTLAWLMAATPPAHAFTSQAYAALLRTHVRPGTIDGVRLNVVDYRGVKADRNYPDALRDFAAAKPETFRTAAEPLAFWINAYNLLAIKAVVNQYPTTSIRNGGSLFRSIWKQRIGIVAGREYALDDIEHGLLRKEFKDPRVHMAIVCASVSCPDLRTEPYVAERLDAQLDEATRMFLANHGKGLVLGPDGRTAEVSSIFKWFREDFSGAGGVAAFIRSKADPSLVSRVSGLTDNGLSYLDYNWSLNDAARSPAAPGEARRGMGGMVRL